MITFANWLREDDPEGHPIETVNRALAGDEDAASVLLRWLQSQGIGASKRTWRRMPKETARAIAVLAAELHLPAHRLLALRVQDIRKDDAGRVCLDTTPVSAAARAALRALLTSERKPTPEDPILRHSDGTPLSRRQVQYALDKVATEDPSRSEGS